MLLIVLLAILAVPTLRLISGGSSIESAHNQVAALLGRARGEAVALQQTVGVAFFIDPATGRTVAALVADDPTRIDPRFLDLLPERDHEALPVAVGVQTVSNHVASASGRASDGYLSFGVILFDGVGRLVSNSYAVRHDGALGRKLRLPADLPASGTLYSQFGLVLFDRQLFAGSGFSETDPLLAGAAYSSDEKREETWIDENGLILLVNRYNGTLVRGE